MDIRVNIYGERKNRKGKLGVHVEILAGFKVKKTCKGLAIEKKHYEDTVSGIQMLIPLTNRFSDNFFKQGVLREGLLCSFKADETDQLPTGKLSKEKIQTKMKCGIVNSFPLRPKLSHYDA